MVAILIIIAIWLGIAFIYSKVKSVSFGKSIVIIPLIILSAMFESGGPDLSDAKRRAKKQGNQEAVDKINEYQKARKKMKENSKKIKEGIDNMKNF